MRRASARAARREVRGAWSLRGFPVAAAAGEDRLDELRLRDLGSRVRVMSVHRSEITIPTGCDISKGKRCGTCDCILHSNRDRAFEVSPEATCEPPRTRSCRMQCSHSHRWQFSVCIRSEVQFAHGRSRASILVPKRDAVPPRGSDSAGGRGRRVVRRRRACGRAGSGRAGRQIRRRERHATARAPARANEVALERTSTAAGRRGSGGDAADGADRADGGAQTAA